MSVLMDAAATELAGQPDEHPPVAIAPTMTSHIVYTRAQPACPRVRWPTTAA